MIPCHTLFISDLHLSAARPATTQNFLSFLRDHASQAETLYLLGDVFDAYIGDDDNAALNRTVKAALKTLTDSGVAVYFQHGNRDFLVGERFARETGVVLLGDYAVIDLYGTPALLTHGDLLCTDDILYQAARQRVRAAAWQQNALSKPLWMRQCYARWYRFKSGLDKSKKTQAIMDANADTIRLVLQQYNVPVLIHGHTHRPAVHELTINGAVARRFVLPEWTDHAHALRWQADGHWCNQTFAGGGLP